jgi:Flp pilus assembly protein TadG
MIVLLGTAMLVFMGFAFDLGRLYLNRAELKTLANAMAIAAATNLIGTEQSLLNAQTASRQAASVVDNRGNRYDFSGITLGEGTANLTSEIPEPSFFETMAAAIGTGEGGADATGGTARHARVEVRAEAPLVFFGLLFVAQERKVQIAAASVAGLSAPVCSACGVEPLALAAPSQEDTVDFGFVRGQRYTLYFSCNGQPLPQPLGDGGTRLPYLLINRLNAEATNFADEATQLFRNGLNGIPPSSNQAQACINIGTPETNWVSASPRLCNSAAPNTSAQQFVCGLNNRFDPSLGGPCESIPDAALLTDGNPVDTDLTDVEDYAAYTGTGRRVITVPIVDILSNTAEMNILGFRQFLLAPNPGASSLNPTDAASRLLVTYIGYPKPLRQGRFGSCGVTSGPGMVVLHQ